MLIIILLKSHFSLGQSEMNEREIFLAAKAIVDLDERVAYLSKLLGDDSKAIDRINALLDADQNDSFMSVPDEEIAPTQDYELSEKPGGKIGPYKLIEKIGEGGFGVVFMAQQSAPVRRTVALKVIKPGMDSRQVVARFEAERQALAIMDHPNVAKVLDAGTTETGRPFFVMELVKGIAITKFCDEKRLDLSRRLELFVSVCQAIHHAHSKGIIHRDIKPGNVLVAMYDDKMVPKVIDFGVAKATGQQLTEKTLQTGFGAVVGSLEYMSPEQASFNQLDIDTRSDVYSLGVLLYELLTGTPPLTIQELRQQGILESLRMVRETEPTRPSLKLSTAEGLASLAADRQVDPSRLTAIVRGDLDWIVMKALDKDRNRRYENVIGLSQEIQRYLNGEAVLAHPPSQLYRLKKGIVRHWQAVLTITALTLLLAVVAGLSYRSYAERTRQIQQHSARVLAATNEANLTLGNAQNAKIGSSSEWTAARASAKKLREILAQHPADDFAKSNAQEFLDQFSRLESARTLAEQVEGVVILSATHADLESWERMERQFEELFRSRDLDFDSLSPQEFAQRIRESDSSSELSDALELWIGTRGQIMSLGGKAATMENMQPMADALFDADPDRVRTGIRKLVYGRTPFKETDVDRVVGDAALDKMTPRTLSWLATVYTMAQSNERANEIMYLAADLYPDDFMLNFDFALSLESQKKWSKSIRYYLRCTALRPDVSGTWRALGNAYRENSEFLRSRESLQRAAKLNPNHPPIYVDLAKTLIEFEDFEGAGLNAQKAIDLGSRASEASFLLGTSLMKLKRYAEAIVALERCEKLGKSQRQKQFPTKALIAECKELLTTNVDSDKQDSQDK